MTVPDFRIPRVFGAMLQEEQGKGECAAGAVPARTQGRDTGFKQTGSWTPGVWFPFAPIKSNGEAGSALKDKAARRQKITLLPLHTRRPRAE